MLTNVPEFSAAASLVVPWVTLKMALLLSDMLDSDDLVERQQVQEIIWAMHLSNVSSLRKCTLAKERLGDEVVGCYLCSEFGLEHNLIILFNFFSNMPCIYFRGLSQFCYSKNSVRMWSLGEVWSGSLFHPVVSGVPLHPIRFCYCAKMHAWNFHVHFPGLINWRL